jgi:DNA-binding NarL/FixJ family response regulator
MTAAKTATLSSSVLLIDNNQLRRAGIASLLSEWVASLETSLWQASPQEILSEFEERGRWRLVVLSVGGDSIRSGEMGALLRVLPVLAGEAPLVVMSDREEADEIVVAYRHRCRGYIPTSMDPNLAQRALSFVISGGAFFPPTALALVQVPDDTHPEGNGGPGRYRTSLSLQLSDSRREEAQQPATPRSKGKGPRTTSNEALAAPAEADELTMRQSEVLDHLRKGQSNKLIARSLGLTEGTVKVHVRQIMRKFGAANRTEVAVLSIDVTGRTAERVPIPGELRVVESNGATALPRSTAA